MQTVLLNFSRTSTTEFRETNLNQVIRDTLSLLEHQFKTAQVEVDLALAENLPSIHGNPGKLQQVFLNLLLNAKEAMPGGGRLRVATLANGHVEAMVSDSGSGIAPENLKRIYDPFFTTKTMPKPGERRGTGLGLSVSVRHYSGARRKNSCRERDRRRDYLSSRVPPIKEDCSCLRSIDR